MANTRRSNKVNNKQCRNKPRKAKGRKGKFDIETYARLYVEEELTKVNVRKCPGCKRMVSKIEGCDSMYCNCGKRFCFNCGKFAEDCWSQWQRSHVPCRARHERTFSMALIKAKARLLKKFPMLQFTKCKSIFHEHKFD